MNPTIKGKVYQVTVVDPDASTEGNVTQVEIVGGGQVKSMFEPQESLLGLIVQYVGETTSDYTNGYFYQVIESEDVPGTYVWANKTVQSGGGAGAVSSVNGQTGDVILDAEDVGATTKNVITLTGESGTLTSAEITKVLDDTAMLEIVCDGEVFRLSNKDSTLTYRTYLNEDCALNENVAFKAIYIQLNSEAANYGAWSLEEVSTGGGGLPDQTGKSGRFLTTDGTNASWGKALVNSSNNSSYSLTIAGTASQPQHCVNIGHSSSVSSSGQGNTALGALSSITAYQGTAIGYNANVTNSTGGAGKGHGIALGASAKSQAEYAIQLGMGTNTEAGSFYVGTYNNGSVNYKLLGADGKIPAERLGTGYDATKTQVLKNIQGVLTWVDEA